MSAEKVTNVVVAFGKDSGIDGRVVRACKTAIRKNDFRKLSAVQLGIIYNALLFEATTENGMMDTLKTVEALYNAKNGVAKAV